MHTDAKITDLIGHTFTEIKCIDEDRALHFICADGTRFEMYHQRDCCESVYLEDTGGDLDDLIGAPIISAEEASNANGHWDGDPRVAMTDEERTKHLLNDEIPKHYAEYDAESFTWTFYRIATQKGSVCLRWLGESNGFYSEDMDLKRVDPHVVH